MKGKKISKKSKGGFSYNVDDEEIKAYRKWTVEDKLRWIEEWNRFLLQLPPEIRKKQEKFRKGEI